VGEVVLVGRLVGRGDAVTEPTGGVVIIGVSVGCSVDVGDAEGDGEVCGGERKALYEPTEMQIITTSTIADRIVYWRFKVNYLRAGNVWPYRKRL
jgi:hypothetical protein